MDKLDRLPGGLPCVLGFGGSSGRAEQARAALAAKPVHPNQLRKRELARAALVRCLAPIYEDIKRVNPEGAREIWKITLAGLAALWAEGQPQILEFEFNGDSSFHSHFHAIGSASDTAYAVYRTLGGKRLSELHEPRALMALIRIIRTSVDVEMWGVSEPVSFWVVGHAETRRLSEDELQPQLQFVDEWEERERSAFFDGSWPLSSE